MIDLAAMFQEATAQHAVRDFPDFPTSSQSFTEKQVSKRKAFSGISGISDAGNLVNVIRQVKPPQARASAGASERARGACASVPEMPEMPEMATPAGTWLSDFPSGKLKKEREVGKRARLPAAPSFNERAAFLQYECGLSRTAAEAQARAETDRAASPTPAPRPSLARLPNTDGLTLWRAGLALLFPEETPCPGYRAVDRSGALSGEWSRVLAQAIDFLDTFGAQAEALGWTAPRLFGVHPSAGIVRVDCCGALVLPCTGTVRAITAKEISFGHLTHREKPGQPTGVPIWEFGR